MQPSKKIRSPKKLMVAAGIFLVPIAVLAMVIVALTNRHAKQPVPSTAGSGFNTQLPSPNLPKKERNKLEIYMQAQQDSLKAHQAETNDPFTQSRENPPAPPSTAYKAPAGRSVFSPVPANGAPDENERKVNDRLQKIYAALGQVPGNSAPQPSVHFNPLPDSSTGTPQIDRLERLMGAIQSRDTASSPQLQQVSQVLDKILAIQHPTTSPSSKADSTDLGRTSSVTDHPAPPPTDFPSPSPVPETNGFFGVSDEIDTGTSAATPMMAVVHSNQTIVSGAIVKLRLLQDIYINGQRIPANNFIYGPATVSGERVTIQLTNVTYAGKIYPISLKVYDAADGLEGLFVPGMITRDVVKENMSQGVSSMNLGTLDPSLGAQAAAAGIETARSLLSRKIRLVKATLKEGHLVILRSSTVIK